MGSSSGRRGPNARSHRYVSADIVGADDLDEYGRWEQVPQLRLGLDSDTSMAGRLGALPRRALDLAGPLGLDVGFRLSRGAGRRTTTAAG